MAKRIGVLIVEDQDVVRIGLNLSLESSPDIEILGEAVDGVSAVTEAIALKPDVILMDIGLPKLDGIAAATLIKKELSTRIIMFTEHDDDQSVFAALSAGADGYCLKDVTAEQLVKAIGTVVAGAVWLDDRVAGRVLRSWSNTPAPQSDAIPEPQPAPTSANPIASSLQMDVLSLMVEGLSAEQIASRLQLNAADVNSCLVDVMENLSKSERAQAALADLRREMFKDVPGLSKWCPKCQRDLDPSFEICPFDGTQLDRPSHEHLVGKIFADRYEIIELLGQGAMGIVYKARHKFMNRVVAIKILHPFLLSDLNNVKRFRQEAEAASALQHANVIHIHDFGLTSSGEAFLVMELLEGTGLDEVLAKQGPIPVEHSIDIFIQCCDALEHAHKHGIIHRDLKPSNIVLVKDQSGRQQVKIVDFGIAKFTSKEKSAAPSLTQEGSIHGSPMYMSPEQCQAFPLDARSDIYSFGCLMYETVIGSPPFQAENSIDAMYMHCRTAPPSLLRADAVHTIPVRLDQIILKALSKEPAKRQQTIAELRDELIPLKSARSAVN